MKTHAHLDGGPVAAERLTTLLDRGRPKLAIVNVAAVADEECGAGHMANQTKVIMSWINNSFLGPEISWFDSAGQGMFCFTVYEAETATAAKSVCQSASTNAWHFVTVGASPYHQGKSNIFISVDNATRATTAVTYWQHGGPAYMRIGGRPATGPADNSTSISGSTISVDAYLAELDFFARPLANYEQTLLYNGGGAPSNALAFPYDTN